MWNAIIESKAQNAGSYQVGIVYTNGISKFSEALDLTGQDVTSLNTKVQARLDSLNKAQSLDTAVILGNFVSSVLGNTPLSIFNQKLRVLQNAKMAVDLGLLQNTDPAYATALSDATKAFDVAFLGHF